MVNADKVLTTEKESVKGWEGIERVREKVDDDEREEREKAKESRNGWKSTSRVNS